MDAERAIITALEVAPGNGAAAADRAALVRQEAAAHGNDAAERSSDGMRSARGDVLRVLDDPDTLGVVV